MSSPTYTNVILTLIFLIICWASFQLSAINTELGYVEANTGMVQKLLAK